MVNGTVNGNWGKWMADKAWLLTSGFACLCFYGFCYLNTAMIEIAKETAKDRMQIRQEFLAELKSVRAERKEDMKELKSDIITAIKALR